MWNENAFPFQLKKFRQIRGNLLLTVIL